MIRSRITRRAGGGLRGNRGFPLLKKDVLRRLINIIWKGYKELRETDISLISRRHIGQHIW